ncbi:hypothetical protein [Pseudooceanicola aestuarii]|uniref:hypothetical protein n=1 Tax=Pseudooceanicola aestuarii TaxID=2697319 RepID=UPI0013D7E219|nr:hypothetical protein [Pseudooceanicola aestuarii]
MTIELNTEGYKLLAEIGFLGISRGMAQQAEVVFSALHRLRPEEETGPIGLALTHLAANEAQAAVQVLEKARQSDTIIAFRCLAHARLGDRDTARELRDELHETGAAETLTAMADGALAEA